MKEGLPGGSGFKLRPEDSTRLGVVNVCKVLRVKRQTPELSWCRRCRHRQHVRTGLAVLRENYFLNHPAWDPWRGLGLVGSRESCRQGRLHTDQQAHRAGVQAQIKLGNIQGDGCGEWAAGKPLRAWCPV